MLKNAIVVMFDTLSLRFMGCYGNDWIKTPNFDRFAREGVLFENSFSEGLPTVPVRRAMLTGRFTLPVSGWVPLNIGDTTIADLCWGRPIDTALVFDCPMFRLPKFGYTRGFDKVWFTHGHEGDHNYYENDTLYHKDPMDYIEEEHLRVTDQVLGGNIMEPLLAEITSYLCERQYWTSEEDRYVARTMKNAVKYLEQIDKNKQFFLWIDSFDPHEPWDPPSVYLDQPAMYNPDYQGKDIFVPPMGLVKGIYTDEQLHHVRMLYAELITVCDTWFGHLMEAVRRLGLEDTTLIMQVSDHGEPLGYGEHGHGLMRKARPWPYDELVHVPMMLKAPGITAGQRIKAFVQSVDVAPTVCDWLGIGVHPSMQGKSLLPLCRGEVDKIRDWAIAGYHKFSWSLFTEDWSYIRWVNKGDELAQQDIAYEIATRYIAEILVDIDPEKAKTNSYQPLNEASAKLRAAASIDGEDQWTCTPGSKVEVPEGDELYNFKTDPYQLNNVIKENPKVAEDMLRKLRTIMSEIKAS